MRTTVHGKERIRKRIGINKKAVEKMKDKAFTLGLTHSETTGSLNKYYTFLYFQNESATNIRIYANYVWIFTNEVLITVFPVPNRHKNSSNKLLKRKVNVE